MSRISQPKRALRSRKPDRAYWVRSPATRVARPPVTRMPSTDQWQQHRRHLGLTGFNVSISGTSMTGKVTYRAGVVGIPGVAVVTSRLAGATRR